jgi:hypothetical protein
METTTLGEAHAQLDEEINITKESHATALDIAKRKDIRRACQKRDILSLVAHASTEGGFLEDELRRMACESLPLILTFNYYNLSAYWIG